MKNKITLEKPVTAKKGEWWHDFFPAFRPLFDNLPKSVTRQEVDYIIRKLGLRPGAKFLDCPCGIGRISIPLAKKGIRVTGVDVTGSYLEEVEKKSRALGLGIKTVHADMRRIDFDSEFDAAGNLWTSFGYFENESDDQLVLKKLFRALKPGGRFMLHLINRDWIIRHYTPTSWQKMKRGVVLESRHFDYASSRNVSTWRFMEDGRESVHDFSLRLYSYHELLAMMTKAGFVELDGWGSTKDELISFNHMMMFIVGKKPKRSRSVRS